MRIAAVLVCCLELAPIAGGDEPEGQNTFGWAIANVGDANGDGVSDFAVGACTLGVYLFSGKTWEMLWHIETVEKSRDLGYSLAFVGDVNGDGHADVLAGARASFPDKGLVTLLSGVDGAVIATLPEEKPASGFGSTLAAIDLDGDGLRELIVGAPDSEAGALCVFSGKTRKLLRTVRGLQEGDRFGAFLAAIDDGKSGLLVSAPNARSTANPDARGRVSLLSGAELATQRTFEAAPTDARFGYCACALTDLDGDGQRDFAFTVLLPRDDKRADSIVRVVSGASGKTLTELGRLADGFSDRGDFGRSIAALDDWDADGVGDIAVGAPLAMWSFDCGIVSVFSGRTGKSLSKQYWTGEEAERDYGTSLALIADADGDGKRDLLVGAPDAFNRGGVELLSSAHALLDASPGQTLTGVELHNSRTRRALHQIEYSNLKKAVPDSMKR